MADPLSPTRGLAALTPEEAAAIFDSTPAPRGIRERASVEELVISSGELTPLDLQRASAVEVQKGVGTPTIKSLRYSHHRLAQFLAGGMNQTQAAALCNYSPSRVSILKQDPAFQELLAHYAGEMTEAFTDFVECAKALSIDALHLLQQRMDENPESFTNTMVMEVMKATADRSGNAPVAKTQSVNVHYNMGDRLRLARERVNDADRTRLIEGQSREVSAA